MQPPDNARIFRDALSQLRGGDPIGGAALVAEGLVRSPDDANLLTLLGACLRAQGADEAALEPLSRAIALAPGFARAFVERGMALLRLRRDADALADLGRALEIAPDDARTRRRLAQALVMLGRGAEADRVIAEGFARRPQGTLLLEAAVHQREGRLRESEPLLRAALERVPHDPDALRMLAAVALEAGRLREAERLLREALEHAPGFDEARLDLARVLKQRDNLDDAVACCEEVIARSPRNALAHYLHASLLALCGRHARAREAYASSVRLDPGNPAAWLGMGHLLKTIGEQREAIDAYREAMRLRPRYGEVYWSLANLKTFRFAPAEIEAMEAALADPSLDEDSRVHFLFALGKAREDGAEYARAFALYADANALQRMRVEYDPVETETTHRHIRAVFDAPFLAVRARDPIASDPVPIFIVGLPRSGSTLIEQILASHPLVDGTAELFEIGRITSALSRRFADARYPEAVAQLDPGDLRELGRTYLDRTRRHRTGRPFFTDKMPNNFASIGFIRLILPQARFVDARRHPLDSCLGCFRQHFAMGQSFTYDLVELGEFYLEYRRMMEHWHAVLPGAVLELRYEDLVREQEAQTRRLLAYCGLPWEPRCLRFHETARAVRTASSEQVRLPIYDSSVDYWTRYRTELAPLLEVLAPSLEAEGWRA
jgi:tetratricopeptide (TPR) repeat protein